MSIFFLLPLVLNIDNSLVRKIAHIVQHHFKEMSFSHPFVTTCLPIYHSKIGV